MCLLVASKTGVKMTPQEIGSAALNNPHGIGFACVKDGTIQVWKMLKQCELIDLIKAFEGMPQIVHFRYATHGGFTKENCHPFLNKDWCMAHNGVIQIETHLNESDTRAFIRQKLARLRFHEIVNKSHVIKQDIGRSKLAFLSTNGELHLINEEVGHYRGSTWFSNDSYRNYSRYIFCKRDTFDILKEIEELATELPAKIGDKILSIVYDSYIELDE